MNIVVKGNPLHGFKYYGPFKDHETANQFHQDEFGISFDYWVIRLHEGTKKEEGNNQYYDYVSEDSTLSTQLRVTGAQGGKVVIGTRANNKGESPAFVLRKDIPELIEQLTGILKEGEGA